MLNRQIGRIPVNLFMQLVNSEFLKFDTLEETNSLVKEYFCTYSKKCYSKQFIDSKSKSTDIIFSKHNCLNCKNKHKKLELINSTCNDVNTKKLPLLTYDLSVKERRNVSKIDTLVLLGLTYLNVADNGFVSFLDVRELSELVKASVNAVKNSLYKFRELNLISFEDTNIYPNYIMELNLNFHKETMKILTKDTKYIVNKYNENDELIEQHNNVLSIPINFFKELVTIIRDNNNTTNTLRLALFKFVKCVSRPFKSRAFGNTTSILHEFKSIIKGGLTLSRIKECLQSITSLFDNEQFEGSLNLYTINDKFDIDNFKKNYTDECKKHFEEEFTIEQYIDNNNKENLSSDDISIEYNKSIQNLIDLSFEFNLKRIKEVIKVMKTKLSSLQEITNASKENIRYLIKQQILLEKSSNIKFNLF